MAKRFIFTQQADNDLLEIYTYTYKTWGEKQAEKYTSALKQTMQKLADAPALGKRRNYVRPGYYSYHQGKHLIFYRCNDFGIEIVRILHESMDYQQQFED